MAEPMALNATQGDYNLLWQSNPLAAEQLKTIILARTTQEQAARIAELELAAPVPKQAPNRAARRKAAKKAT